MLLKTTWNRFAYLLLLVAAWLPQAALATPQSSPPADRADSQVKNADRWVSLVDDEHVSFWKFIDFGGREAFEIEKGVLTVEAGYPMAGFVYKGAFPKTNYELELEAKKIQGTDFFCLVTFPVGDQFCSLVVGGWGGTVTGISCIDGVDASENKTKTARKYEKDRWYKVRIQVTPAQVHCWLDDETIVDLPTQGVKLSLRTDVDNTKPLSVCSFETISQWKNIRFKSLK